MVNKKSNPHLINLIQEIKEHAGKESSNFWRKIVKELERTKQQRREVSLFRLNKLTKDKEIIIVPGKVIGDDNLDHELTVAAFNFSKSAKEKIKNTTTIKDLLKTNPKGKGVRIIC
jgi:large subunit ribosomal protein L18e